MKKILTSIFLASTLSLGAKSTLPMLTFVNDGDTLVATYDDAPRILYDRNWYVDYNADVDKFLSDEGLGRYRSVKDDVLARVAISRMFMNSKLVSIEPPQVIISVSHPSFLEMSPEVFRQMGELMAMLNRNVADEVNDRLSPTAMDEEHAFRDFAILCKDNTIWEKEALNPGTYTELSFSEPLPKDKGPKNFLPDTLGVIDYNPRRYAYNAFMPPARELQWYVNDMTAKYRFFSHVVRNPEGKLVQTATASDLRLSPEVWNFLTNVLDGLNEDTPRVNNPAADWATTPEEAERMAREFFMAKNRGASSRLFNNKGKLKTRIEPTKPTSRPTRFEYRFDAFNRHNGTGRKRSTDPFGPDSYNRRY